MQEQDTSNSNMITNVPEHLQTDQPIPEDAQAQPDLITKVPDEIGGQAVHEQAIAEEEASAAYKAANPTHTVHTTIGKMPPHEPGEL